MQTQRGQGRIQSFRPQGQLAREPRRATIELEVRVFRFHRMSEDHRKALAHWLHDQAGQIAQSAESGFYGAFRFGAGWERTAKVSVRNLYLANSHERYSFVAGVQKIASALIERTIDGRYPLEPKRVRGSRGERRRSPGGYVYRDVIHK